MNVEPTAGASDRLEVRIARKTYPGANGIPVDALRDCAFALPAGCVGALIGPSGVGKTTVLRIVAGLDRRFAGTVHRPGQGRLGIVFQEPRLLPWRTLDENVRLAVASAGIAPGPHDDLYEVLGIAAQRDRYPGELSLGQARRAAIARAFAVEPDLLLLDEPFVSLDPETAQRLGAELAALQDRLRPTTLIVTHDLDEALALADHVFVMDGPPGHVAVTMEVEAPRSARDAAALGDLRARLARLRAEERGVPSPV